MGNKIIPQYIKDAISQELLDKITNETFGLSFVSKKYCQVRYQHLEELSIVYVYYDQFGGIENSIKAAMEWYTNRKSMALKETPFIDSSSKNGAIIHYTTVRNGDLIYVTRVRYFDVVLGKETTKQIQIRLDSLTTAQWLHMHNTALVMREHAHIASTNGESPDFSCFKGWKSFRYYKSGHPGVTFVDLE